MIIIKKTKIWVCSACVILNKGERMECEKCEEQTQKLLVDFHDTDIKCKKKLNEYS